ncbi:QRFP-like peptide receptor [Neocloeon triangulifer]|uniref:QRFP-like peptide receptor n=1 Tax=Neocloeon triangulifer TaxID=2078957 RepID=UPI00286F3002|nr:QRFP-like peptide receptor [Neocloeon triangulifer]
MLESHCKSIDFNSLHFDFCSSHGNVSDDDDDDMSEFPIPVDLWCVKPWWEITIKVLLFLPVVIGGVLGNAAILNAVRKNRLLRMAPLNLYIANLAACDLCALIIGPWLLMCIDSFQNFVLGAFFCKTEGFVQSSLLLGGVFSLIAISADRFVAIVFPKKKKLSMPMAWCVVATTWILGIAISVPLIIFREYKERQWLDFLEKYCKENSDILSDYWTVMIAFLVWLPLLVMFICYSAIFCKLTHYARQARRSTINPSRDFRTRVTRMVLILVLVFTICRVPFTALIYVRNSLKHTQIGLAFRILWWVSHFLIYTNAAINPLIYGMTNDGFRRAIRAAYSCNSKDDPNPQTQQPIATPLEKQASVKVLEPREPYHIEPCWRPSNEKKTCHCVQKESNSSIFTVGGTTPPNSAELY